MLDKIMDAAYEEFLQQDSQELLKKRDIIIKKIQETDNLTKIFLDDLIGDICNDYEDVAFQSGFRACVECLGALTGKNI